MKARRSLISSSVKKSDMVSLMIDSKPVFFPFLF